MKALLTEKQINFIMETLSGEQRSFLEESIKQSKKSKWLEMLAGYKGIVIDNSMNIEEITSKVQDWILTDILDGGYGNRPYRCECGNSLRFQYIIHHTSENKTVKLGSKCFENYTSLSPVILRDINKGFYHIDLERDEILTKFKKKSFYDISSFFDADIPQNIIKQFSIGLPLTDNQIRRVLNLYEAFLVAEEERKEKERQLRLIESLGEEQRDWIASMFNKEEQFEIINKLQGYEPRIEAPELKKIGASEIIIKQVELGLPLTNKQEFEINAKLRKYNLNFLRLGGNKNFSVEPEINDGPSSKTAYEDFIDRFGDKIQRIRENEGRINERLRCDWSDIQNILEDLKNDRPISSKSFQLKLSNLLTSLGIYIKL